MTASRKANRNNYCCKPQGKLFHDVTRQISDSNDISSHSRRGAKRSIKRAAGPNILRETESIEPNVPFTYLRSRPQGIRKILCSFWFALPANDLSSLKPPWPQLARNGRKHNSRDCNILCG